MSPPLLQDLLSVAMEAARLGGVHTLKYFNERIEVEIKADRTPVTRADRESEHLIRTHISKMYPDHAILGEEGGNTSGNKDYQWIIDPIDGTKTFISGVPFYGVLIGVEVRGKPSVGVIYLPALDEMVSAATGDGCRWNGKPARVSEVSCMKEATLLCSCVAMAEGRSDAWERLASTTKMQRTWGDCYGYVLVATGRAEIMMDPVMNLWDCAPMLPILEEAGGRFTDWKGEATIRGKDAVATNAALQMEVLEILKSERQSYPRNPS